MSGRRRVKDRYEQEIMEEERPMPQNDTPFRREHVSPAVIAVFGMLAAVYAVLFFRLYPCVPWNCDDWTYLGLFHPILPGAARWNPARVFQEFFMPLGGYFAAYVMRPLFGLDYLQALTLVCSGLAAAAWLTLNAVAYRFFRSVARESSPEAQALPPTTLPGTRRTSGSVPALCGLLLLNAGFFLPTAVRLPLAISAPEPSILFAYDLPNILNALLVIALCRALLGKGDGAASLSATPLSISGAHRHATALACGLIIVYFAQFSITIASAMSAIPAGSLLLFRLFHYAKHAGGKTLGSIARQATFLDLFCCLLVVFWFSAAFFELRGSRFASLASAPQSFLEILTLHYHALSACIPRWLCVALLVLIAANMGIIMRDTRKGAQDAASGTLCAFLGVMGLSFLLLLMLNILIFHTTKIGLDNRFLFGLVFYVYITLIVNALFLQKRVPVTLMGILPLPGLLFANVMLAEPWMPRPILYAEHRKAIVQEWLDDIRYADKTGESEALIRTPTPVWPHPKDYLGDRLARTLYHHGITSKHMTIRTESPAAAR